MKIERGKVFIGITLTLISFFLFVPPFVFSADPIRIGIIGDQTGADPNNLHDLTYPYKVLKEGVDTLNSNSIGPLSAVIHTGDLVESTSTDDQIRANFKTGSDLLNTLTVEWHSAAGDHDVNPLSWTPNSPDRSKENLFKELYWTLKGKPITSPLYHSFDVDTHHFIALFSEEVLRTDPRWGNIFMNTIPDDQFNWLKQDLEANKANPGIVVFLHQPMWYDWTNWARVHNLLRQYPVIAVIAGHFHYNQIEAGPLDGIQYMIVGATGGHTKTGTSDAGDLQHVTVMTINGANVTFDPIPLTEPSMIFTQRGFMDRIQAMDTILGNVLFSSSGYNPFQTLNPVFLKNGTTMVNDCASSDPAGIKLQGLGNPTDVVVNLGLQLIAKSPSIKIASGQFVANYCKANIGPYNCQIPANQWMAFSNNSGVQLIMGKDTTNFWTGTLEVVGNTPPLTPQDLQFRVEMSFRDPSTGQNYMVYQNGITRLTACP